MGVEIIVLLVVGGTAAIIVELFLPGGIVGLIGVAMLIGAIVTAYGSFGPQGAVLTLLAEVGFVGIGLFLWAKYFPESRWGRRLAVSEVIEDEEFRHRLDNLLEKSGDVVAPCRPSGIVEIEGRRYDVESEGAFLEVGTEITVVQVEGTRVVVRPSSKNEGK